MQATEEHDHITMNNFILCMKMTELFRSSFDTASWTPLEHEAHFRQNSKWKDSNKNIHDEWPSTPLHSHEPIMICVILLTQYRKVTTNHKRRENRIEDSQDLIVGGSARFFSTHNKHMPIHIESLFPINLDKLLTISRDFICPTSLNGYNHGNLGSFRE